MTDVAYYLSFVLNVLLAVVAFFLVRNSVKADRFGKAKAKYIYSVVVLIGGVLSGLVLFHAMVGIFRVLGFPSSYGHGEVIVAAILFNLLLSLLLLVVGRILLDWRPVRWP